jgi:hypothetical protein
MDNGEGILYADVERDALVSPKIVQDFAGHYNRFDLLSLSVRRSVPLAMREHGPVPETGADNRISFAQDIASLFVEDASSSHPLQLAGRHQGERLRDVD